MIDLLKILGDWVTFVNWCMLSIIILMLLVWLYDSLDDLWINFCEGCKKWWKGELSDEEKEKQKELDEWVEMELRTFKDKEEQ